MTDVLARATVEQTRTGRTLEGLAARWDFPSSVSDGAAPYLEEFARSSADRTIRDRPVVPLGYFHPFTPGQPGHRSKYAGETLGAVRFAAASAGLAFTATVSRTQSGDDMLELLEDGALEAVSLLYRAIRTVPRSSPRGTVQRRTEIGIVELSLAPPGMGQHDGAQVLAVRAAAGTPRLDALTRRVATLVR